MSENVKNLWLTPFKKIRIFSYESLPSTNLSAKEYAATHASDAVIVAKGQTAGRGRLGRSFASDFGAGIYMSILIHPKKSISDTLKLTALAGVAVCRAIEKNTELNPKIKWVNDIQVQGKKVSGILAEGGFGTDGVLDYAVVGIGLNVLKRDFGELSEIAGALGDFTQNLPDMEKLTRDIVREFYRIYGLREHSAELEYYRSHSSVIGKDITVYRAAESYPARAIDINGDFALVVNDGEKESAISSAEVSVRVSK